LRLYDRNKEVYQLLRYGLPLKLAVGETKKTVCFIDWEHPERNRFAVAEEVTVKGRDARAHTKRPDVVLYVNGIALGVLELKRSTVSVAEGIRQNLDNQKREFIELFFATMQLVMAGTRVPRIHHCPRTRAPSRAPPRRSVSRGPGPASTQVAADPKRAERRAAGARQVVLLNPSPVAW
jgi:type I site-specific restriction-modification system R (restriction) subunit